MSARLTSTDVYQASSFSGAVRHIRRQSLPTRLPARQRTLLYWPVHLCLPCIYPLVVVVIDARDDNAGSPRPQLPRPGQSRTSCWAAYDYAHRSSMLHCCREGPLSDVAGCDRFGSVRSYFFDQRPQDPQLCSLPRELFFLFHSLTRFLVN